MSKLEEYSKKTNIKPPLDDISFHFYPANVYSIEYYLLEPNAIMEAAACSDQEISKKIREKLNQKMRDINDSIKIS
jgi:hypothetical protein